MNSYWEDGKSTKRAVLNLSDLPDEVVSMTQAVLRGKNFIDADNNWQMKLTLPHGRMAAVTGTMKKQGFSKLLGGRSSR
ncbi:MAG: hypothetical protein HQL69_15110 [Magnetococcales bacterium]|nr:hypothetical protein [Magnetococcales bacterium]